jgi:hypothetical protein
MQQTVSQGTTRTSAPSSSANPSSAGLPVTFTATVAVVTGTGTPTGSVTFRDGGVALPNGTVNLGGNTASFTTAALTVGSHTITAVYNGNSNFSGSTSSALAQTVNEGIGTTFLSFEGAGTILDNPPSTACKAAGYSFGDTRLVDYRFSLTPSVPDAISFVTQSSVARMVSTQSPNFSLNGASTVNWDQINSRASSVTLIGSSSNLTIQSGLNAAITTSTGNIKIVGTINDFELNVGCTVHYHATLVARPN